MKNIFKNKLSLLAMAGSLLMSSVFFTSCEDDDDEGMPEILYVRSTSAAAKDSLMERVSMGQVIAIMGNNLGSAKKIYFNDVPAKLNVNYITDDCIIVTVPTTSWVAQNDSITIYGSNGIASRFYCPVDKTLPRINSISNEYAKPGEEVTIKGSSFFNDDDMLAVEFPGVGAVDIKSSDEESITVVVPDGTVKGAVRVVTKFGAANSAFNMYDDRNMITDFTTPFNGWGKHKTKEEDGNTFVHFSGNTSVGGWNEDATILYNFTSENVEYELPEGGLNDLYLKFECRVNNKWDKVALYIRPYLKSEGGTTNDCGDNKPAYCWEPWKANGSYEESGWRTISIPMSNFKYTASAKDCEKKFDLADFDGLFFFLRGGSGDWDSKDEQEVDMDIDNLRIEPYK